MKELTEPRKIAIACLDAVEFLKSHKRSKWVELGEWRIKASYRDYRNLAITLTAKHPKLSFPIIAGYSDEMRDAIISAELRLK